MRRLLFPKLQDAKCAMILFETYRVILYSKSYIKVHMTRNCFGDLLYMMWKNFKLK